MTHRLASDADFDFIYKVYMDKSSNPYLTYDPMEREAFRPIFGDLLKTGSLYIVCELESPVGTYRLIPKENRQKHCVYLGSFGIDSERKGRGYGFKILEELKAIVKKEGRSRIELTVDVNNSAAIHLYTKAGFETEGRLRNSYKLASGDSFYDEYLMAVLL
jgi:L-phenylalanine/L-methionine N-acetyltransferase